jgi:hypothetical protein
MKFTRNFKVLEQVTCYIKVLNLVSETRKNSPTFIRKFKSRTTSSLKKVREWIGSEGKAEKSTGRKERGWMGGREDESEGKGMGFRPPET